MSHILCDIGGTNLRLAFSSAPGDLRYVRTYPMLEGEYFINTLQKYQRELVQQGETIQGLVSASAGPIQGSYAMLTNLNWRTNFEEVQVACGLSEVYLLNDFSAQALAIPLLPATALHPLGSRQPKSSQTRGKLEVKMILGAGTGLGVSGLQEIPDQCVATKTWLPLDSEGGHLAWGPMNDVERDIQKRLELNLGRSVDLEDLLSGVGLTNIFQVLLQRAGLWRQFNELEGKKGSPSDIVDWASQHRGVTVERTTCSYTAALPSLSSLANESVLIFCEVLAQAAGNLAITFMAEAGVYLSGGIPPRLEFWLKNMDFRSTFERRGKMTYMLEKIPVYLVTYTQLGLLGCSQVAHSALRELWSIEKRNVV